MNFNVFDLVTSVSPSLKTRVRKANSYAVIDTETTGVLPAHDRIIELAIIGVSVTGEIEDEYVSLVNPSRDLGPSSKHGIKAKDVNDAPSFEELAGDIIYRLQGRTIIGHNVSFDLGMLTAEFNRLGYEITDLPHICTRRLAYEFGPSSRKLNECCAFFGIDPGRSHSALDDAHATFKLFSEYMKLARKEGLEHSDELRAYRPSESKIKWPELKGCGKVKRRTDNNEDVHPFLSRVISNLPDTGNADFAAYFSVLDRALEDRVLTEHEVNALQLLAESAGFTKRAIVDAHEEYFRHLIRAALDDGLISENEMCDLISVGGLLGLDQQRRTDLLGLVKALTRDSAAREQPKNVIKQNALEQIQSEVDQSAPAQHEFAGKRVCFTGALASKLDGVEISRETAIRLASERGMFVTDSVSKKTEVLVVADPHTMSGKAKKAREYGIRIVADRVFWKMIGVKVD